MKLKNLNCLNKYFIISLIVVFVIYSCDDKKGNYEIFKIDDSTTLNIKKDKVGNVLDSFTYKNGKLEGVQKMTDTVAKTISYISYKNGVRQGEFKKTYFDNKIRLQGNYHNDTNIGSWYQYLKNGNYNIIEGYTPDGELRYIRLYDSLNKIVKIKGEPFLYFSTGGKDTFKLGEQIELNFNMVIPKHSVAAYNVIHRKDTSKFLTVNESFYFSDVTRKLGNDTLKLEWKLADTVKKKVEKGTAEFLYFVKKD